MIGRAALLGLAAAVAVGCGDPEPAGTLFRGATVVDGRGGTPYAADVVVRDASIVAIEPPDAVTDEDVRVVDARGLVLAPGFVDMHSHADLVLLAEPPERARLVEAKLRQGVTTWVVGNCGLGVAPADPETAETLAAVNGWMTPAGVRAGTLGVAGYLDRIEASGPPMNVATLLPHGPLRLGAMGTRPGPPDANEREAMVEAARQGLDEGAFGISTGLIYPPGMYSDPDELRALASVVAGRGGLWTSHVRGSSETLLAATDELIALARATGARVHHSHLEAVGEPFWPAVEEVLAREDAARADGVAVSHDVFPYTRAATMMAAIFPPWSLEGGVEGLLDRLRDPDARERIADEIATRTPEWPPWIDGGWPHNLVGAVGWDGIRVAGLGETTDDPRIGRSVADLAAESGADPFDVVADLMLEFDGNVGQWVEEISGEAALRTIVSHPAAAIVSDAEDYGHGVPHPAHAGAFARVLRWSREGTAPPLAEVVRRMTSRPARIVGLPGVGVIEIGARADLVLFDPVTVTDRAADDDPRRPAEGVRMVMVAGHRVVDGSRYDPAPVGRVLRSPSGPAQAREFDFWVGEWDVDLRIRQEDGSWPVKVRADARIYPVLDGKAVLELWDSAPIKGFSLRYFDPARREWVLWLNWPGPGRSGGSALAGRFTHGRGEFFNRPPGSEGNGPLTRYTFSDIAPDRLRWDDAFSDDGGGTWTHGWRMEFRRRADRAALPEDRDAAHTYGDGARCTEPAFRRFETVAGRFEGTLEGADGVAEPGVWHGWRVLDGCAVLGRLDAPSGRSLSLLTWNTYAGRFEESRLDDDPDGALEVYYGEADGGESTRLTLSGRIGHESGSLVRDWRLDAEDGWRIVTRDAAGNVRRTFSTEKKTGALAGAR